ILKDKDSNGISYLQHTFRLYQKIFNVVCTSCPGKIPKYIKKLKNLEIMSLEKQENTSVYKMKKGVVIAIPGTSKVYSEHNITDKIAKQLLKENPNRKTLFSVIPQEEESN